MHYFVQRRGLPSFLTSSPAMGEGRKASSFDVRLMLHIGGSLPLVGKTAGTRVPVPSSHCTIIAHALARSKRVNEGSGGEGSASIIYCGCGTRREAARRPPADALRRSSGNPSCSLSSSLSAIALLCM